MVIIFNSAFVTEDFETIDCRKLIAYDYLKGWFWIDLLAVMPFQWFIRDSESSTGVTSEINQMIRILRIGRLSKLLKLMKLIRILKFLKKSKSSYSISRDFFKLGAGSERLFFFVLISMFSIHLITCLWLYSAILTIEEYPGVPTWLQDSDYIDMAPRRQYLLSLYYVTLISYGNGDDLGNDFERGFGLLIMILGGMLMTYSISVLSQIINSLDQNSANYQERLEILNRIH